jgi:septum formation protein
VTKLVLASASAIRAALLERAGLTVVRDAADLDEAAIKAKYRGEGDAAAAAAALAEAKAKRVGERHPRTLVIGADQILVCEETWFDKPRDRADSRRQLQRLRGRTHELVTAVALCRDGQAIWRRVDRPRLTMRRFSDAFLDEYLDRAGESILSSVGGYQLEGLGAQLFDHVEGDFFAVLGLPLLPLLDALRRQDIIAA